MARVYFDKTKWILRCSEHKQTKSIQLSTKKFRVLILFCTVASQFAFKVLETFVFPNKNFFIVANNSSATSDGSREGLNQRQGGSCVTHNMRVQVRVHTKFQDRFEGEWKLWFWNFFGPYSFVYACWNNKKKYLHKLCTANVYTTLGRCFKCAWNKTFLQVLFFSIFHS